MNATRRADDISTSTVIERFPVWADAVSRRHSRRAFDGRALEEAALDEMGRLCEEFRPYPDARVALVREPGAALFTGIVGSYGKVTGAPHALAVIAREDSPAALCHAGYTGEALILEATSFGLDTCWVGGFFDRRKASALIPHDQDERILAVSPLGHALGSDTARERLMRALAGAHRRKPVSELAPGAEGQWPAWALAAVEAARTAPSAMNRQPWRFRLEGGALVVSRDSAIEVPRVTKALDCGIAMLHAEVGALAAGARGSWYDCDADGLDVARYVPE